MQEETEGPVRKLTKSFETCASIFVDFRLVFYVHTENLTFGTQLLMNAYYFEHQIGIHDTKLYPSL